MAFRKMSSLLMNLGILAALCIFAINILESGGESMEPPIPQFAAEMDGKTVRAIRFYVDPHRRDHELEYEEFCERQKVLRKNPAMIAHDCKRVKTTDFHEDDIRVLFTLFMIIMWGALVRTFIRAYQLSIPYTVILLFSGMIIGIASKYQCHYLHTFTTLGRLKPPIILYTFLPVLIFETAFGISSHVFFRAVTQILVVALPGMLIATGLTACLCYTFFPSYQWTFLEACFFGSIVSATDPVAVVAILKEVGVSESLSVIIDGESLLNDGVAIVLFEIFKELLMELLPGGEDEEEHDPNKDSLAVGIIKMLATIGLGGPAFGFLMAKVAITSLARIFNDACVEITITLAAAYLTYYIAEAVLHCSGVISVVILGLTMSAERTCISPQIMEEVVEFWEMCAHLANTVLFFTTGIIIAERGTRDLKLEDFYYLLLLYFALNLIRLVMLAVLSPILSRTGYGLTWENMTVMVWGGLRGAVGICLSLEVYEEPKFCTTGNTLGPKVLFQTAGIVVLTLVVNGSTTKMLLDALKLTAVTRGRMEEMEVAVKHVLEQQKKAMVMFKHDRFLQDANWDYVRGFTRLDNPYDKAIVLGPAKLKDPTSILSFQAALDGKFTKCPDCQAKVLNEPSNEEYRVLTEESRLRIIKGMKISYWSQFEQGLMTEDAVKILVAVADTLADRELYMVHCEDLRKYWTIRGIIPWLRSRVVLMVGNPGLRDGLVDPPKQRWRRPIWIIACHSWFDPLMTALVFINLFPTIWEFALDLNTPSHASGMCDKRNPDLRFAFYVIGWIFLGIYILECLIKSVGRGFTDYWTNKWNYLDFFVLLLMILDAGISFLGCDDNSVRSQGIRSLLKGLRLFRLVRCIRLLKPLVPATVAYLNSRVNRQLFLGFDVIIGYITAIDDVLKYLRNMIENPRVLKKLKAALEKERLNAVRETGTMSKGNPGIAIAVKTRHASRSVLNQMRTALNDLRMDGLLDDKENTLLTIQLEELMKRLWTSPDYIRPSSPEVLLDNLIWVYGNSELKDIIFNAATLVNFNAGDVIVAEGEEFTGIYVIVSGMIKIVYDPTEADTEARAKSGVIPIKEIYKDFEFLKPEEDFLSSGTVIGEAAYLLKRNRSATVTCETDGTTAYFIPKADMDAALARFNDPYDSFESRLWRAVGIRRGVAYLPTTPFFETWAADKVRTHLERSCVPLQFPSTTWIVPPYVMDIILIEGLVQDYFTGDFYIAPRLIPRLCKRIVFLENPKTPSRMLLLTEETLTDNPNNDDVAKCVIASYLYRRGFADKTDEGDKEQGRSRFYKLTHFNIRQKKRRNTNFYSADSQKNDAKRANEATRKKVLDANTGSAKKFTSNAEVAPSDNPPDNPPDTQ